MMGGELRLFALSETAAYGKRVADALGVALSSHEERPFEDGEHKTRPLVGVRGCDVYVLHSLYGEPHASANDKLCRALFFIGALKDALAARVTLVAPYLCYMRKDRRTKPRDPVITRYVASVIEAVGTDRVVAIDVHNIAAFENGFRCPVEHLEAKKLFVDCLAPLVGSQPVAVVSPDVGGAKRAEALRLALAKRLGREPANAFVEKYRSEGKVSGELLVGDVEGRVAIILDDLVSTGGTLARAAAGCRRSGAKRVYAAATHGLFIGDAARVLAAADIDRVVVTDTIPPWRLPEAFVRDRLTVLDTAPFVAEAIARMHSGGSIVELLEA
jgi:ribose-phosphate pyrophosphokinase